MKLNYRKGEFPDVGRLRQEEEGLRYPYRVSRPQSLLSKEVGRVEDEHRKQVTVVEAAEFLDLTPGQIQDMVERGVLKADKFAGAIHIPREEVERIERETAPQDTDLGYAGIVPAPGHFRDGANFLERR